ncbi:MAG: InlB B-repeat-containing protein, partial [Anaerolineae bacterium]
TVQSNVVVTATFEQITYTLDLTILGTGDVDVEPDQATYLYGDVVTLTASSEPCYTFIGWSGDATGSELVKVITITSNLVITATFDPTIAIVTKNVVGGGFMTVQPEHPVLNCGDHLTFTASAYLGWYFAGWSGDVSGPANPTSMTISVPTVEVTATFEPYSYSLAIDTVGRGSVSKDPDQAAYIYSDVVTLTANPDPGWYLYSWSGAVSGTSNPQAVTILGNTMVTATFRRFTYTVSVNVVGDGLVEVEPTQATYRYGDVVTLTASTDDCHSLTAWSGDLTGNDLVKVITITDSFVITATFDLIPAVITTIATPLGKGSVVVQPDPTQHLLTCGSVITVSALAQPGWNFAGWSGDASGTNISTTVTITDPNVVITANFIPTKFTLTVYTVGNGTVSKDPNQPDYIYNDVVTLTATPAAGWYLVGWSGDASGMDNPLAVTIQSNRVITATFAQLTYTLNVNVVGEGNVDIDLNQATYLYGDVVTLTATTTDNCHRLTAWSGDASGSGVVEVITIYSSMNITATFEATPAVITKNVVGSGLITVQPEHPVVVCGDMLTVTASADPGWNFEGWSGSVTGSATQVTMTITDPNVVITATFNASNYMLRIDRIGNGDVTKDPDKGDAYITNDVVTLTAVPDPGWYLVGWAGAASGSAVETTIVIHANTIVTATFAQLTYTVTANVVGIGSVDVTPSKAAYLYGDVVTLTASTDICHSLTGWSGSLSGSDLEQVITITDNVVVTATFDLTYAVVTKNLLGKGDVVHQPDHPNLVCDDVLTFTAAADMGWYFAGWSGAVTGSAISATMTIADPNMVVTATFEPYSYTLAVGTVGNGTVSKDPDLLQYIYGDVVTLTANPDPGWYLVAWSGNASGNANPKVITITGNTVITATFDRITYTVDVVVQGGLGTATREPSQTTYFYGDVVTVSVVPAACNFFVDWTGDASGTLPETTVTVTQNMMIYANLTPSTHTITVNVVGLGAVLQVPLEDFYGCSDLIQLYPIAEMGWYFDSWSGDLSGTVPYAEVIIDNANVVITATFKVFEFSVHANTVGNGTVELGPDVEHYHFGEVVTLTAIPDPGWYLVGWSEDASGSANPLTITVTANTHILATFERITYTLDLNTVGDGSVAAEPDQATYFYGDVVTLTATANTCSVFDSWSGDASGMNEVTTLTITGNAVVTATFVPGTYTITANKVGLGQVTFDPMAATYLCGPVKLDAFPAMGWFFTGWSGDASGINHKTTVTITGMDLVVTATFEPYTYTLTVDMFGKGSVAIDPDQDTYIYGDVVTLTVTPDPGWYIVGWTGNASGNDSTVTVTIQANTIVTITLDKITYTVTALVDWGNGSVSVSPVQPTFFYGDEATVTAVPDHGWFFIGWTGDVISTDNPLVVTVHDNTTVYAAFGTRRIYLPMVFTVVPEILSPN